MDQSITKVDAAVEVESNELFSDLQLTTVLVGFAFSNLEFYEEGLIEDVEPNGNIKAIGCNYGMVIDPEYEKLTTVKKSNRGRKKKEKDPNARKRQGNGTHFNSAMQFTIQHHEKMLIDGKPKVFKTKVYRNGEGQVPGGMQENISDVIPALTELAAYLDSMGWDKGKIALSSVRIIMINFKFCMKGGHISLGDLQQVLLKVEPTVEFISKIRYNPERYPGLIVQIKTPRPIMPNIKIHPDDPEVLREGQKDKKITIKIFESGKINIDGAYSSKIATTVYDWLKKVFAEYYNAISFNSDDDISDEEDYMIDVTVEEEDDEFDMKKTAELIQMTNTIESLYR
jgi:TATA-box binding protein (TBP) (component of TFIID and TFIIIB)